MRSQPNSLRYFAGDYPGAGSSLLRFDDRTADGAGAGEPVVQGLGVTAADRALQGGQILAEALQQLQNRLAVRQEDVAPHHRVGGGDAGEVAEPPGRESDDLG